MTRPDHTQVLSRAMRAQEAAREMAIISGDIEEENRCNNTLANMRQRERSQNEQAHRATAEAWRMARQTKRTRGTVDYLAKLAASDPPLLSRAHLAAAEALRDHMRGDSGMAGGEIRERVDGGFIHNGQMEAATDRRRPLRHAANVAMDAVQPVAIKPGVLQVILHGVSLRTGCEASGLLPDGRNCALVRDGVWSALDAAATYLGIQP